MSTTVNRLTIDFGTLFPTVGTFDLMLQSKNLALLKIWMNLVYTRRLVEVPLSS